MKFKSFEMPKYIMAELSEEEIAPIKEEVFQIQSNFNNSIKRNNSLAGHIRKEFTLTKSTNYISNLMQPLIHEYNLISEYYSRDMNTNANAVSLQLISPWVNFQKKHEFNPLHNHSGVFSFVIWLNIPYNINDELEVFPDIPVSDNLTGSFAFYYSGHLGSIDRHIIPTDKSFNNRLVLFPSCLNHCVYPFYTSDDYRISVSGNFFHV